MRKLPNHDFQFAGVWRRALVLLVEAFIFRRVEDGDTVECERNRGMGSVCTSVVKSFIISVFMLLKSTCSDSR